MFMAFLWRKMNSNRIKKNKVKYACPLCSSEDKTQEKEIFTTWFPAQAETKTIFAHLSNSTFTWLFADSQYELNEHHASNFKSAAFTRHSLLQIKPNQTKQNRNPLAIQDVNHQVCQQTNNHFEPARDLQGEGRPTSGHQTQAPQVRQPAAIPCYLRPDIWTGQLQPRAGLRFHRWPRSVGVRHLFRDQV